MTTRASSKPYIIDAFPENASEKALKFQPVLDFVDDGCYQSVAISPDNTANSGLDPFGYDFPEDLQPPSKRSPAIDNGGMRPPPGPPPPNGRLKTLHRCRSHLVTNSQTYVRERCNHGWCAYLYGYYFESDLNPWTIPGAGPHRHDWEHVIVFTLNDQVFYVSVSAHGEWYTDRDVDVQFEDGTHPKIVYDKTGVKNHFLRKATADDVNVINETGKWHRAPLLSVERMECKFVGHLMYNDWGEAHPELTKERFGQALDKATPSAARENEGFDPWQP